MSPGDKRGWGLALGWLATTGLAVLLALAAVGAVSDSVTERRPEPLSAEAVSAALAEGTRPTAAPTATTASSGPVPAPSTTTQPPPATAPPATVDTAPTGTTRPTTPPPSTGTTGTTGTTAGTGPDSSTAPTTGPAGGDAVSEPEDRTYELVGGTVRVRFAGGRADLLSASPRAGFRIQRHSGSPGEVRVTFRSDDHESRFRAWWDNGPQDRIEEKKR